MIKYVLIIFLVFFSLRAVAAPLLTSITYVLPAPPKTENALALYSYLNQIYQHWNTMQVTTQEPNGNFTDNYGQFISYFDGTNYWIAMETAAPSGSTWVGVKMGSV